MCLENKIEINAITDLDKLYIIPTEIKYIHKQTLIKLAKANISL